MHQFSELIYQCTVFTFKTLNKINKITINKLKTSAETELVKTLQMIQLQKVIFAVGMFSIFEANLQHILNCENGFKEAQKILNCKILKSKKENNREEENNLKELLENFCLAIDAINVLKHGRGRSHNQLINKMKDKTLPFNIKLSHRDFFSEGDVSEVSTLIEVDDVFVERCNEIIKEVSDVILKHISLS